MGINKSFPLTGKNSIEMSKWNIESVAISMQGRRDSDEDAALLPTSLKNFPNCKVAGVFDGHNGSNTSVYCVKRLASILDECQNFSHESIVKSCLKLDKEIKKTYHADEGSTAIFVIVEKSEDCDEFSIQVCNIGDSRCLILRTDGTYEKLSSDHKPTLKSERDRIEAANGNVIMDRVMGNMAVSRAFGDMWYKKRDDLPEDAQWITCIPDIKVIKAFPGDVLILACDGLFEQLTWDDVAKCIRDELKDGLYNASMKLIDSSLIAGSLDNMTVLLMQLLPNPIKEEQIRYRYLPGILFSSKDYASKEKNRYVNELRCIGFNEEQIMKLLDKCPNRSSNDIQLTSTVLEELLNIQQKMEKIEFEVVNISGQKLISEKLIKAENNGILHYIPYHRNDQISLFAKFDTDIIHENNTIVSIESMNEKSDIKVYKNESNNTTDDNEAIFYDMESGNEEFF